MGVPPTDGPSLEPPGQRKGWASYRSEADPPGRVHEPEVLMAAALDVAAGEDAGDVVEHVGRRVLVVAVVADQAGLDDVDLLLGVLVDDAGDQAGELDRILLVLEQLELQGLLEAFVGPVIEPLAVEGQRPDVVHDLAAEVVLAAL